MAQRWICTGKQIFIIHDDTKIYDKIDIPAQQQGKNIMNGPLPFLFGLKAEQAKARGGRDIAALLESPFVDVWAQAGIAEVLAALHERLVVQPARA